jgi:HEAT repeat protein
MPRYREIIDRLVGSTRPKARKLLLEADGRVLSSLKHALHNHPKADVREEVAEILGERRSWKAIPALIDALDDESRFVRQDAIWSIEAICMMQPAALSFWLDLASDTPDAKARVERWWQRNKQFVENNRNLRG